MWGDNRKDLVGLVCMVNSSGGPCSESIPEPIPMLELISEPDPTPKPIPDLIPEPIPEPNPESTPEQIPKSTLESVPGSESAPE